MKKRYYSLDILKLISAIFVVLCHFQQETQKLFNDYFNFFGNKNYFISYIVPLFFMISGFVTAINNRKNIELGFKKFIVNKIERFYPMAALSIFAIILIEIVSSKLLGITISPYSLSICRIVDNLMLTFSNGVFNYFGINNPLWYLSVLIICLVLYYIALWIANKNDFNENYLFFGILIFGLVIYIEGWHHVPYINSNTATGYMCFFLGCILYYIYKNINQKYLFYFSYIVLAFSILLGIYNYEMYFENDWWVYTFIIFPTFIFTMLSAEEYMSRLKIKQIGNISFEIYVWHPVVLKLFLIIDKLLNGILIDNCTYITMTIFLVVAIVFSIIMVFFVEKKITLLFHKVLTKLNIINI